MKGVILALGVIGAIFGLFGAIFAIGLGGVGDAFEADGSGSIMRSGVIAVVASIAGLIGAILVFSKPKIGGWLMIGAAIVGFIATFVAYIIGGIFLLISGILALTLKEKAQHTTSHQAE